MKQVLILVTLGLVAPSVAFPAMAMDYAAKNGRSPFTAEVKPRAVGFDATAQHISTSGAHTFTAPGPGDQRGPCPGLNALANHNYIPHNGVATIQQFIDGTNSVFGMGLDLAGFLSIYGAVMDGDLTSWSIGGPSAATSLTGLLSQPQGISYSHNKYETDGSPTRGDLYQYGNAFELQMSQWKDLYSRQAGIADNQVNYNLPVLTQFRADRVAQSKANNPYFFSAPFAGVAVQPAAYTFIYRFMSNKSAEYPEGRLDRNTLKSFFAISGDEGSFTHSPGHERIPDNWYKRAIGDEYTIPFFLTDVLAAAAEHPEFLAIGGNTGTTNSFTGVDLTDLTGGLLNAQTLLQGNNLWCFVVQAAIQFAPDFLQGIISDVTGAVAQLTSAGNSATIGLSCPQLSLAPASTFSKFPGFTKLKSNGQY